MNRETPEYAAAAIARLRARLTGRYSFDAWIYYAIRQWEPLLKEEQNK